MKLRHSVRAIILTDQHEVLLCRHVLPDLPGRVVWAAPGGGVEDGETPLAALRRELAEEIGLAVDSPPHVWHQEAVFGGVPGHDGVVNDYFLVRAAEFVPRGSLSDDELAAENITELRWWSLRDIRGYRGPDLFSPRDLATPLAALIDGGVPGRPVPLSL
ncbi:NUDIX domain-containing protein [Actinoplanes sp. NBC_00393]|uniref:NUDIX hydrolase n=1 Tax=Actinoplanes sp. NBC_00393 TaxID=2975953 RepID=UPI002E22B752